MGASDTHNLLHQENVQFVQMEANAPCFASLHPVEDFWAEWWRLGESFDDVRQATNYAESTSSSTANYFLSI